MPPDNLAPAEVVRALFAAHAEGRLDDFMSLIHPEMLWEPEGYDTRPFYVGREGSLALLGAVRSSLGDHYIRVDDVVPTGAEGQVHVKAAIVLRAPAGDRVEREFEALITVRDGFVSRFEDVPEANQTAGDRTAVDRDGHAEPSS